MKKKTKQYPVPRLFVDKQSVLDMRQEALEHAIETGGGVYGLIIGEGDEIEAIIVLGVIEPTDSDIDRKYANVAIGGNNMAETMKWLKKNHLSANNKVDAVEFTFLFQWHSHHQLKKNTYSGTDIKSITEWVTEEGSRMALGPLVNYSADEPSLLVSSKDECIEISDSSQTQIKFYYYSKGMVDAKVKQPIILTPEIVDFSDTNFDIPKGWHLVNKTHFDEQLRHLDSLGAQVHISSRNADTDDELEVVFLIRKPDSWKNILQIVTNFDFPNSEPTWSFIPERGIDQDAPSVVAPYYANALHLLEGPLWKRHWDFSDLICRLEARGVL